MPLDPIRTTQAITESYLNYLSTTFRLQDPELQSQFEENLHTPDKFVKGPILEATPPFKMGATLEELIRAGILSSLFRELRSEKLPLNRPLYLHQQLAIEKIILYNRNIIVATGTGSGKTEAFLIPILQHLFKQAETGKLDDGVRALLLYPTNALANDQMARLRELLKNVEYITFGRYTGETKKSDEAARDLYRHTYNREPYNNELISREKMWQRPPHILLTNYAMLEYLMLRPEDTCFFNGSSAKNWRFIVVDEAHIFNGAKGIEMAMLLRRLKDRVVNGQKGRLQCIATSATFGSEKKSFPAVKKFAERLFDEDFDWIEEDTNFQDIIKAEKKSIDKLPSISWTPNSNIYQLFQDYIDQDYEDIQWSLLDQRATESGIPKNIIDEAIKIGKQSHAFQPFLHEILKGDSHLIKLRKILETGSVELGNVSNNIFNTDLDPEQKLISLVDLAARARLSDDDQPLLPARYHFFVRAIEGAYISLQPTKKLYLERQEHVVEEGQNYLVFEVASCRQCGAAYLVGELNEKDGKQYLCQPGKNVFENHEKLEYFYIPFEKYIPVPIDEDDEVENKEYDVQENEYKLCTKCGAIEKANFISNYSFCNCGKEYYINILNAKTNNGKVSKCLACGSLSSTGIVWRFLTGTDATASVLTTALYQEIPPKENHNIAINTKTSDQDSLWVHPVKSHLKNKTQIQPIEKGERQLLIFSDSRQDAAFFAPYLDRTYSSILRRRLILQVLQNERERIINNKWRVGDLISPLCRVADQIGIMEGLSLQQQETEVWKWILYELLAMDRRNSLESLGLLGYSLVMPEGWKPFIGFQQIGFSDDESKTLYQVVLASFRMHGAILFPDIVRPDDEFFAPRNREYFFVKKRPENQNSNNDILGWIPTRENGINLRLNYINRILKIGFNRENPEAESRKILDAIWSNDLFAKLIDSWKPYFSSVFMKDGQIAYRIKPDYWELQPGFSNSEIKWYYCDTCKRITLFNIRNICPTYRCSGTLYPCNPQQIFQNNHYRILYTKGKPIRLVAKEHTAQLKSDKAAELQTQFVNGEVNVLSCSTTFELGVDVGELETVFMRNVPPSAANYIQRAGRTGRRTNSAAYALTFAQLHSHDLSYFKNPEKMVNGEIKPPYFEIANEKVVRRHVYATALAYFWRIYPDTYHDVKDFFFREDITGPELFKEYLNKKPKDLQESLGRIVPPELKAKLRIDTWVWVSGLFDDINGVLTLANDRVVGDVTEMEKARMELVSARKSSDFILKVINTIKDEYLISYLSKQNVIPKYGFPVDVVDLQILHHSDEAKSLELNRDLSIALSEYAPSSQVIAGGKMWTSRYVKMLPGHHWRRYRYAICDYCHAYKSISAEIGKTLDNCDVCIQPFGKNKGEFIVPQFGFITEYSPPSIPGEARPEKTYTTRTYFKGISKEMYSQIISLKGVKIKIVSASDGELAIVNHAGLQKFRVCDTCGYAKLNNETFERPHKKPWGTTCNGKPRIVSLGYEFKTDILQIQFQGYANTEHGFWYSLLYALLEGVSQFLEIDRQDIDGVLYPSSNYDSEQTLVLFDNVPGGAGHVRRITGEYEQFVDILKTSLEILNQCNCGGLEKDSSCYSCLRNYYNQFCHDQLKGGC